MTTLAHLQAIRISKLDTKRKQAEITDAPVFYPTVQEFLDPILYISKYIHYSVAAPRLNIYASLLYQNTHNHVI